VLPLAFHCSKLVSYSAQLTNQPYAGTMAQPQIPEKQAASPRILLVKRSSLGDIVHALPVANALRDTYPDSYIAWLVESRFADMLDQHPALDEVIAVKRYAVHQTVRLVRDTLRVRRELLKRSFDWALDLQGLLKSAYLLSCTGAKRRIGLRHERRELSHCWCNELAPASQQAHAVLRCLQMARYLECDTGNPRFDLQVDAEAAASAEQMLAEAGFDGSRPLVGINPGASSPHKQWPPERFVAVADTAAGNDWVVLGGRGEEDLAQQIAGQIQARPLVSAGRTSLKQLVALISRLDVLVTGDTGPMHIAAALGVPTVALFGPTDPAKTGPFGDIHKVIWHRQEARSRKRGRSRRNSPSMLAITPAEVAEALAEILQRP